MILRLIIWCNMLPVFLVHVYLYSPSYILEAEVIFDLICFSLHSIFFAQVCCMLTHLMSLLWYISHCSVYIVSTCISAYSRFSTFICLSWIVSFVVFYCFAWHQCLNSITCFSTDLFLTSFYGCFITYRSIIIDFQIPIHVFYVAPQYFPSCIRSPHINVMGVFPWLLFLSHVQWGIYHKINTLISENGCMHADWLLLTTGTISYQIILQNTLWIIEICLLSPS